MQKKATRELKFVPINDYDSKKYFCVWISKVSVLNIYENPRE